MNSDWLSIYIVAPVLGWLSAHIVKFVIGLTKGQKDWRVFFRSGSMPSSHTAVVVALATVIAFRDGFGSPFFGIAATLGAIVIFDALNVRRAVGEQGKVLEALVKKSGVTTPFFEAKGHTVTEVIVGAMIGLTVGGFLLQIL